MFREQAAFLIFFNDINDFRRSAKTRRNFGRKGPFFIVSDCAGRIPRHYYPR